MWGGHSCPPLFANTGKGTTSAVPHQPTSEGRLQPLRASVPKKLHLFCLFCRSPQEHLGEGESVVEGSVTAHLLRRPISP